MEKVKTGLPGVAYVRLDAHADWPEHLRVKLSSMTGAAPPVVCIEGVSHRYGKVSAVDGLELDVPAGCLAGLIGPDGVGKSTLLGLIAGARKIRRGAVQVLGGDMRSSALPAQRRAADRLHAAGARPQSLRAAVGLRQRRFLRPLVRPAGPGAPTPASTRCSPAPGSSRFRDRPAGKLSGGMKQKLGLCCALLHDPDLLILDEPTTGIDPLSRRQFWQLLARIRSRRPAMSVLVSTAYMEEAESLRLAGGHGRRAASWPAARRTTLMASTGTRDLDAAFIELLPEARRRGHRALRHPPRRARDGEPAIEATRLTRRFGDFTAVDHVSFRIERGEIFGFLGSNGCGKTTTMKMLDRPAARHRGPGAAVRSRRWTRATWTAGAGSATCPRAFRSTGS